MSHCPNACYMPRPSQPPWFYHPNNIRWIIQIVKIFKPSFPTHLSSCILDLNIILSPLFSGTFSPRSLYCLFSFRCQISRHGAYFDSLWNYKNCTIHLRWVCPHLSFLTVCLCQGYPQTVEDGYLSILLLYSVYLCNDILLASDLRSFGWLFYFWVWTAL
jgi:hypothetical protein